MLHTFSWTNLLQKRKCLLDDLDQELDPPVMMAMRHLHHLMNKLHPRQYLLTVLMTVKLLLTYSSKVMFDSCHRRSLLFVLCLQPFQIT